MIWIPPDGLRSIACTSKKHGIVSALSCLFIQLSFDHTPTKLKQLLQTAMILSEQSAQMPVTLQRKLYMKCHCIHQRTNLTKHFLETMFSIKIEFHINAVKFIRLMIQSL